MNQLKAKFNKLTAYQHFLIFLIILTVFKIVNVFIIQGFDQGVHFIILGVGLLVISSILHLIFSKLFDAKKKFLHSLISTFLIILMLSHSEPEPVRGILVILLLYISKFFIKYKKQNIFNPVVFAIGTVTIISFIVPFINIPPMDFTGIDIRFPIKGNNIPITILPITLALIFNVKRIRKYTLAFTFIITSLLLGLIIGAYDNNIYSYIIIIMFVGTAVIVEPKTSPNNIKQQFIYGLLTAVLLAIFNYLKIPNAIVLVLIISNVLYFYFKIKQLKIDKKSIPS
jgi:hypothetical protein